MTKETVEAYRYPMSLGYTTDLIRRYFRMVNRVVLRSDEQNLTFDQLAKWYDMEHDCLGKTRKDRFYIDLMVWFNLMSAITVCMLVLCRIRVPTKWALKLDVLGTDLWVDDLINRHRTHKKKVEYFMCHEDILQIPILVSERDGRYFVEDGNHRHVARKRRGFRKVRAILI